MAPPVLDAILMLDRRDSMLFWLCSVVLVAAVAAGGGTHAGFYGDVLVQFLSVPLLAAATWPALSEQNPHRREARLALVLCGVPTIILFIQVFPLPFNNWSGGAILFGTAGETEPAGQVAGARALSLTPQASWAAAASLLVPLSVFASVIQLSLRQRMSLCFMLLGLGALSLALGFVQVAQGPGSELRFYNITNPSEAVGVFANRNHFAAHLNVTLIMAALWFVTRADASLGRRSLDTRSLIWFAAAAVFLVADVAGLAMARSRAGLGLAIAVLAGIVLMAFKQRGADSRKQRRGLGTGRALFAAAAFAVLFAVQFGLGGIITRFEGDPMEDLRVALNRTTIETTIKTLPLGTGLGSFVPVYATVEKEADAFAGYANRAHNDLAELLLETGLIGAGLLLVFLAWFARQSYRVWTDKQANASGQLTLQRAASLIIAVLLAHSLFDYPLRTAALSAIFAFFCAVLAVPAAEADSGLASEQSRRGGRRRPSGPAASLERWDYAAKWPDDWQRQ